MRTSGDAYNTNTKTRSTQLSKIRKRPEQMGSNAGFGFGPASESGQHLFGIYGNLLRNLAGLIRNLPSEGRGIQESRQRKTDKRRRISDKPSIENNRNIRTMMNALLRQANYRNVKNTWNSHRSRQTKGAHNPLPIEIK
jgi:hypothetical protein